jgi:ribosomal protein L37AE/L43A
MTEMQAEYECPCCGHEEVEFDTEYDVYECMWCGELF